MLWTFESPRIYPCELTNDTIYMAHAN